MGWLITEWLILCVVIGLFGLALSVVILTVREVVNDRRPIALRQDGSHRDKPGVSADGALDHNLMVGDRGQAGHRRRVSRAVVARKRPRAAADGKVSDWRLTAVR